jgi:cytochrome b
MPAASSSSRVWDPAQRILHWALVVAVALSWWAGEERLSLHIATGYVVFAIVVARTAWGLFGSRYARFSDFVHGPRAVFDYARQIAQRREQRYLGHNPLGGWMVVVLLLCLSVVCVSGLLYTTDRFWGIAWLEQTHRISAWTLVALIGLHLAGVVFTSLRHRENLVRAMFSGRKPIAGGRDTVD